ncbi:SUZ RNA-binding domain-containing isoform X1 [Anabrus simplex]|uniref:SUZ RNA-binding domain-containing isoform X1 n=1 Tax=Anabrus simplex TaxID=316456 RepID=UPI0035A38160
MAATEQAAIVENWEDIEDSATFDTKLLLGSPSSPDDYEPVRTSSLLSSRNGNNGPITFRDDVGNIYLPPEPTVKILKRPKKCADGNEGGHLLNGDAKPRHPIKTLQQREQEYAEARLRILGEARSPEEQLPVATDDRNISLHQAWAAVRSQVRLGATSQKCTVNSHLQKLHGLTQYSVSVRERTHVTARMRCISCHDKQNPNKTGALKSI